MLLNGSKIAARYKNIFPRKMKIFLLLLFCGFVYADTWAVLVAGSNTYYNYRHQADVCHAYQILSSHGISDDHIIVFMYDDIAYNKDNPFPGNIINRPDGPNVYPGVPKDYTGDLVTPQNFLNCLLGKSTVGKNLQSTSEDNVFIYLADHGAPGLFAFPNEVLYVKDFSDTLIQMGKENRYKNLVIYMEACESGSMFSSWLKEDTDIYATSASTPYESSYACYFDSSRNTYLGDVYSVNWLENADSSNFSLETIFKQFVIDRQETNTSTVCEYGNITLAKSSLLSTFMGKKNNQIRRERIQIKNAVKSRRAGLWASYKSLAKWFDLSYSEIWKENFIKDLKQFEFQLNLFTETARLYPKFYKFRTNFNENSCDSKIISNKKCLQKIIEEYFNGYPNVYQLDLLAEINPCS